MLQSNNKQWLNFRFTSCLPTGKVECDFVKLLWEERLWNLFMYNIKNLGKRIKEMRIKSGYSQTELAALTGVRPSTLSEYESGNILPSLNVFVDIAKNLNCTPNDLLKDCISSDNAAGSDYRSIFLSLGMMSEEKIESIAAMLEGIVNEE